MSLRTAPLKLGLFLIGVSALAADVTGIWTGQQAGRRGEPEDVAFRFKMDGQTLTGKLFGDEFDIPIGDASLSGNQIRFTVTATNYYSGTKTRYSYTGTVRNGEMELVRERLPNPDDRPSSRPVPKQVIKLKRLD